MGKGDKKSKRGKIWLGSYGNSRKRKSAKVGSAKSAQPKVEVVTAAVEVKPKAKRTTKKKEAAE